MFWLPFAFFVLTVWSLMLWPIPWWGESVASALAAVSGWALGGLATVIGATTGMVASVALVAILLGTFADLWADKKADRWAKYSTFLIAPLALVASAEFAPALLHVVENVGGIGPQVLTALS